MTSTELTTGLRMLLLGCSDIWEPREIICTPRGAANARVAFGLPPTTSFNMELPGMVESLNLRALGDI